MRHVSCLAELPTEERIEAEPAFLPSGAVVVRCGEFSIDARAVKVIRVFTGCPVDVLNAAMLSGCYVLGAARARRSSFLVPPPLPGPFLAIRWSPTSRLPGAFRILASTRQARQRITPRVATEAAARHTQSHTFRPHQATFRRASRQACRIWPTCRFAPANRSDRSSNVSCAERFSPTASRVS